MGAFMTTTVPFHELAEYDAKFQISSCKVVNGGYELVYFDKPVEIRGQVKADSVVEPIKVPEIKPQEATEPVKTVVCIDCGTEHDANKECWICAPLARAAQAFRKNKRDYAIQKSAEREGLC